MKKLLTFLLALLLCASTALATILAPDGVDVDFYSWTGISCTPAVILCQTISVYNERGDQGGKKVDTLRYTGETIPVITEWDGWAQIYYSDGNKTGWVHSEYLLFDPAWYVCDEGTPVYAYPDITAPRVGYLATGTEAPIITEYDDGRKEWVCISLRGAAGWVRKTARDTTVQTNDNPELLGFRPESLQNIAAAMLTYQGESVFTNVSADMTTLSALLTNVTDMGGPYAGCPFDATLDLYLRDGSVITLEIATDSCCVYRVNGRDYQYARHLAYGYRNPDSAELLALFDFDRWEDILTSPGNG